MTAICLHVRQPNRPLIMIMWVMIVGLLLIQPSMSMQKRCFVCNSRGPMGDCKDAFYYNSTQAKQGTDIEERPCPSGWCGKSVQTRESDAILQTTRFCLQRPPSDGIERCANTVLGEHGGQERFMCFCRGDLCNASTSSVRISGLIAAILSMLSVCFITCLTRFGH